MQSSTSFTVITFSGAFIQVDDGILHPVRYSLDCNLEWVCPAEFDHPSLSTIPTKFSHVHEPFSCQLCTCRNRSDMVRIRMQAAVVPRSCRGMNVPCPMPETAASQRTQSRFCYDRHLSQLAQLAQLCTFSHVDKNMPQPPQHRWNRWAARNSFQYVDLQPIAATTP